MVESEVLGLRTLGFFTRLEDYLFSVVMKVLKDFDREEAEEENKVVKIEIYLFFSPSDGKKIKICNSVMSLTEL